MKKTRLLEIIREEIAGALNEKTALGPGALGDKDFQKAFTKLPGDEKEKVKKGLQAGTETFVFEEEKRKKLAKKYQLDEETINEMASIVQTKKVLTKLGDEKRLELVKSIEKETLDQFKNSPIMSSDGRLARKLDSEEQTGKKDTRGFGADFERNFKKKAGMDFLDFTTLIDIELKKKFPEEKFTPGLATNTTEKEAAAQIFGLEKGQRGRKADPNKPEKSPSTGQKGRPAGLAKEKVATRTAGDDGFDKVTYSAPAKASDEEKALKAAEKTDKALGGKYAKKLSAEEEDLFKTYKRQAVSLANKIEDAESTEERTKLMGQLKTLRNNPEVTALFKAKGVSI
jgi:hypothetical protein